MNHDAIGNIAPQFGIGMGGRVENLGVNAADAFLGISRLDGGIGVLRDANSAHREKTGRSLRIPEAQAALPGSAAKSLANLAGFEGNDVHPLRRWIDDIEPVGIVIGVTGPTLRADEGLHGGPVRVAGFVD